MWPSTALEEAAVLAPLQPGDSAAVDSLARGMAIALADPALRQQIHADLRDSPFSRHRLHLPSYLGGSRGGVILVAIAQKSGLSSARIASIAAIRGGLQLSVPRAVDRMWWQAAEEVLVEGTALTVAERRAAERSMEGAAHRTSAVAYTREGHAVNRSVMGISDSPFLAITPAVLGFGEAPEQLRSAAPRLHRNTISTFAEEIRIYRERGDSLTRARPDSGFPGLSFVIPVEECDPYDPNAECDGGSSPPPRPMGVSIPSGKNYAACYQPGVFSTSVDRDQDGVDDQCEAELAIAFRPQLVFDRYDCEIRRQPQFASRQKVSPDWGGVILIFYAISYRFDCGYPDRHRGDSEWIIVEVGPSSDPSYAPWSLKYATLSAHWKSDWDDNTAGYAARDLEDAEGSPGFGAPRIWVALNKHANYRTQQVCDSAGFWNSDSCDDPMPGYATLTFGAAQNLGSRVEPFIGTLNNPVYDQITYSGLYEYYWVEDSQYFCGWVALTDTYGCAGSYWKSLTMYGF